jgi:AraC-like DNA-binding protein
MAKKLLQNTTALRAICETVAELSSARVVDRALNSVGLNRNLIEGPPSYVPHDIAPALVAFVESRIREPHFGWIGGEMFDFWGYGPYAEYVLDAVTLKTALHRAAIGLPYLYPSATHTLRAEGDATVLQYNTYLPQSPGLRHMQEALPQLMIGLVRRFAGNDWSPLWIELPESDVLLETMVEYEVRPASAPGIAIPNSDLDNKNPVDRNPESAVTAIHLRSLSPAGIPRTISEITSQIAHQKLVSGDLSLESVSAELDIGPRSLQRALRKDGLSFREITNAVIAKRACALLSETDHTIDGIARALGYEEVNSFRRAFRSVHGVSPSNYRRHADTTSNR